jgi:hypothetical protein
MLKFLDGLQDTSKDFVFKGGNLLWHYIKTPRETIDLDLVTISLKSHVDVKTAVTKSFEKHENIRFSVKEFKELDEVSEVGAAVIIYFATETGQKNQFSIDIVYALPTDFINIKSTLDGESRKAASIENIVCDKISAAHQFKSGNTRMKDFDDLWRIAQADIFVDPKKLQKLFLERKITSKLELDWVPFLEDSWKRHAKSYKDIPGDLGKVFNEINIWLARHLSIGVR